MSATIIKPNNSLVPNRIHPKVFLLWTAMGTVVMLFAGFTSAYIVRRLQGNWEEYFFKHHFSAWLTFLQLAIHWLDATKINWHRPKRHNSLRCIFVRNLGHTCSSRIRRHLVFIYFLGKRFSQTRPL